MWIAVLAPYPVMYIMVCRIVPKEHLEWVPRNGVPTVVVHSLEGREKEEECRLPNAHERELLSYSRTKAIQKQAFKPMIVERSKRVRNV